MNNFFLRSRHYVLFIFLIIPTLISTGIQIMANIFVGQMEEMADSGEDVSELFNLDLGAYREWYIFLTIIYLVAFLVQAGWWWSVRMKLRRFLPPGVRLNDGLFKASIGIFVLFQIAYFTFGFWLYEQATELLPNLLAGGPLPEWMNENMVTGPLLMCLGLSIILGLLSFAAQVFICYEVGRTLRSIEQGEPRRGSDALGYSVLAYFLFIGVWVLQPKINRLVESGRMDPPAEPAQGLV